MNEQSVRQGLAEAREELASIAQEREALDRRQEVLLHLRDGFEGWLRLKGLPEEALQPSASLDGEAVLHGFEGIARKPVRGKPPKGTIPYMEAIIRVLDEARGEPLHRTEIVRRAEALGARSEAKSVAGLVDTMCKRIPGAQRAGQGMWLKLPG